jgi:ESCRT-I complex subunit VPS37
VAEEDTEQLASAFLSGDMILDSFLTQFLENRKLSHLRRIKTEKMMEYVRRQPATGSAQPDTGLGSQPIRPAPPPPFGGSPAGIPPYPMGGMPGMPQPGYNHEGPVPSFPFSRPPNFR